MLKRSLAAFLFSLVCSTWAFSQTTTIAHAGIVDVRDGKILDDMTLTIENGRIQSIRPSGKQTAPGVAFNATGKFVIPGLWDMHQHFEGAPNEREFDLNIANGVLGIRNMGGPAKEVLEARDRIIRGDILGPRIFACGPILDGPNPTNPPISIAVHDAEDARKTVQSVKAMHADCVKVHDGIPLDAYFAIADESKKLDCLLSAMFRSKFMFAMLRMPVSAASSTRLFFSAPLPWKTKS